MTPEQRSLTCVQWADAFVKSAGGRNTLLLLTRSMHLAAAGTAPNQSKPEEAEPVDVR